MFQAKMKANMIDSSVTILCFLVSHHRLIMKPGYLAKTRWFCTCNPWQVQSSISFVTRIWTATVEILLDALHKFGGVAAPEWVRSGVAVHSQLLSYMKIICLLFLPLIFLLLKVVAWLKPNTITFCHQGFFDRGNVVNDESLREASARFRRWARINGHQYLDLIS